MRKVEKYVLWMSILSLLVVSASFFGLLSMFTSRESDVIDWSSHITRFSLEWGFSFLPNFVGAFWLGWAAKTRRLSKLPWVLLAIAYGTIGIILFYVLLCYFELSVIKQKINLNET